MCNSCIYNCFNTKFDFTFFRVRKVRHNEESNSFLSSFFLFSFFRTTTAQPEIRFAPFTRLILLQKRKKKKRFLVIYDLLCSVETIPFSKAKRKEAIHRFIPFEGGKKRNKKKKKILPERENTHLYALNLSPSRERREI